MTRFVALLRGINVGGKNLIRMTDLRVCFENHGFQHVVTIQSGNVLFTSAKSGRAELARPIEETLGATFNYQASLVLRSRKQMQGIVERAPEGFGAHPARYRYEVIFLKEPLTGPSAVRSVPVKEGVDQVADNIADAETLSNALDTNQARADIAEATMFLNERAGQAEGGLAVTGFSLGAYFALELSVADPEHIRSVVIFYGTRAGDYSSSRAAYLGHFAETDEFEPQSDVDKLEAALRRVGRPVSFYRYIGTGHWFFE
ncbi:MAG: DUF1697 domain-containing protein [bacterium]